MNYKLKDIVLWENMDVKWYYQLCYSYMKDTSNEVEAL